MRLLAAVGRVTMSRERRAIEPFGLSDDAEKAICLHLQSGRLADAFAQRDLRVDYGPTFTFNARGVTDPV